MKEGSIEVFLKKLKRYKWGAKWQMHQSRNLKETMSISRWNRQGSKCTSVEAILVQAIE